MSNPLEYAYGIHSVEAMLTYEPSKINQLFILNKRTDKPLQKISALAQQANLKIKLLARHELDSLVGHTHHQGVVAAIQTHAPSITHDLFTLIETSTNIPLLLVLDEVQDPHNLGACIRSANAAGALAVIAPKDKAAGLTATVRKVACGAAEITPFIQVTNLARTLRELKQKGIWVFGLAGEASKSLYQADLTVPTALIMGAEGTGLRKLTRELCDELLYIPMAGKISSLNVSVAAGVTLFEAVRQRSQI